MVGRFVMSVGLILGFYTGYSRFEWYLIFFCGALTAIGWMIQRAPQVYSMYKEKGILEFPKIFILQFTLYSIISAMVYFLGTGINILLTLVLN
jgi:hypothetical protein